MYAHMLLHTYVCLSVCVSVCLPANQSICLSVCPSACLSVCLLLSMLLLLLLLLSLLLLLLLLLLLWLLLLLMLLLLLLSLLLSCYRLSLVQRRSSRACSRQQASKLAACAVPRPLWSARSGTSVDSWNACLRTDNGSECGRAVPRRVCPEIAAHSRWHPTLLEVHASIHRARKCQTQATRWCSHRCVAPRPGRECGEYLCTRETGSYQDRSAETERAKAKPVPQIEPSSQDASASKRQPSDLTMGKLHGRTSI